MRLRVPGQYADEEMELLYNRFRYYDPRIGRFTTQDLISLAGGINLYQYAPNPVGWIDPYGLSNCDTRFGSRKSALKAAKRDAGVPASQQPDNVF